MEADVAMQQTTGGCGGGGGGKGNQVKPVAARTLPPPHLRAAPNTSLQPSAKGSRGQPDPPETLYGRTP